MNFSGVIRPAMSSPIGPWCPLKKSPYQSLIRHVMTLAPTPLMTLLIEARAVPPDTASAPPLSTVGALVSSENLPAPSLESMARRNSMPPFGLFALAGTIHDSAAYVRAAPYCILSLLVTSQQGNMVISKPGGIFRPPLGSRLSFGSDGELISLSNQVPTGMNAARPSRN